MAYVVVEFVGSRHLVAQAVECLGDGGIVSKISPSGASIVAVFGQSVASQEEQQQGNNGSEVEVHLDLWCFLSIIDVFVSYIGEGSLLGSLSL